MAYRWDTPTKTYSQLILNPVVEIPKPSLPKPVEYTYELVKEKSIKDGFDQLRKYNAVPVSIVIRENCGFITYTQSDVPGEYSIAARLKKIPVMQEGNK